MKLSTFCCIAFSLQLSLASAAVITAVPGPDDQGGMLMPMLSIVATEGPANNPTAGKVSVDLPSGGALPVLRSLNHWSPGNWFEESAAWRTSLSPVAGSVPGMPTANAGSGDLFNNQYGFMFMQAGLPDRANVPAGHSLAIRLDAISSPSMQVYNYVNSQNRWDQVFDEVGAQVLWNGGMWHNYFTLPATAPAGTYTVVFEVFVADAVFLGGTGNVQYDEYALSALKNEHFESAFVTYDLIVIPEISTFALVFAMLAAALVVTRRLKVCA